MERAASAVYCLRSAVCIFALGFLLVAGMVQAQAEYVALGLTAATHPADSGPAGFAGATAAQPHGASFINYDVYLPGGGDCRVYYNYQDNLNYHFLDRRSARVTLGLCEAGVEQVFATGVLTRASDLRLARHECYSALFQDGLLVLWAFDDRLRGGRVGLRMLDGRPRLALRVEAREELRFADDFMIDDGRAAQWRGNGSPARGDFAVRSLRSPLLSANAFSYLGAGSGVYSVVGQDWWDQYHYQVALRGPGHGRIGLVFAFQDDHNYGLFRWTPRGAGAQDLGRRELVRVRNGQEEVLSSSPGGYLPDQWYGATVEVTYGRTSVALDGHTVFETQDRALMAGGAGVWCDVPLPAKAVLDPRNVGAGRINSLNALMQQHAVFDDVRITSVGGVRENFASRGRLAGGWLTGSGEWEVSPIRGAPGRHELVVGAGEAASRALIGDGRWGQYEVYADLQPGKGGAGLIFLHRDEGNYYAAVVSDKRLRLVRVAGGKNTIVDEAPLPAAQSGVRLTARVWHGHIRVSANQAAAVEYFDTTPALRGRAGLLAGPGAESRFQSFHLAFLAEAEPLVTSNAVFDDEGSMQGWADPLGDWAAPSSPPIVDGRPVTALWHHGQFPGDVELSVEPREIMESNHRIALSVAKDLRGKNNGYVLLLNADGSPAPGKPAVALELVRQGERVAEQALELNGPLASLALRRCGKYVVGVVNGRPELVFSDPNPLTGTKVAFWTTGVRLRTEANRISSPNFKNELFSAAPTAWRTAGNAVAEVTNRWQCDPRWSFFSLRHDFRERTKGKAAVLWSKRLYPGDVTIEAFVSQKMEDERGQRYTYSRDLNFTICSDGSDLTKGYTFMFGGQNNAGSMILRNREEVARSPKGINYRAGTFHHHWFAIKIEKRGNVVSFRVDRLFEDENNKVLMYEDTQPLTGSHLAIWTYDNGMMISRLRISGEGGEVMDSPDWRPGPLKTVYE